MIVGANDWLINLYWAKHKWAGGRLIHFSCAKSKTTVKVEEKTERCFIDGHQFIVYRKLNLRHKLESLSSRYSRFDHCLLIKLNNFKLLSSPVFLCGFFLFFLPFWRCRLSIDTNQVFSFSRVKKIKKKFQPFLFLWCIFMKWFGCVLYRFLTKYKFCKPFCKRTSVHWNDDMREIWYVCLRLTLRCFFVFFFFLVAAERCANNKCKSDHFAVYRWHRSFVVVVVVVGS